MHLSLAATLPEADPQDIQHSLCFTFSDLVACRVRVVSVLCLQLFVFANECSIFLTNAIICSISSTTFTYGFTQPLLLQAGRHAWVIECLAYVLSARSEYMV